MPHREKFGVHINSIEEKDEGNSRSSLELHLPRGCYVPLEHGSRYEIRLSNDNNNIADVLLLIDGYSVGGYRLEPHSSITISHPPYSRRQFIFFGDSSDKEGELIQAIFRLKARKSKYTSLSGEMEKLAVSSHGETRAQTPSLSDEMVILGGEDFTPVVPINHHDVEKEVEISVHLKVKRSPQRMIESGEKKEYIVPRTIRSRSMSPIRKSS